MIQVKIWLKLDNCYFQAASFFIKTCQCYFIDLIWIHRPILHAIWINIDEYILICKDTTPINSSQCTAVQSSLLIVPCHNPITTLDLRLLQIHFIEAWLEASTEFWHKKHYYSPVKTSRLKLGWLCSLTWNKLRQD